MFLLSAENGAGVNQKTNITYGYDEMLQAVVLGGVFPCLLVLGRVDCHQFKFSSHPTGGTNDQDWVKSL